MARVTKKLVLTIVAFAVIGAAGTAAAASLVTPHTEAPIHSAFASHAGDSLGVHMAEPTPPPTHQGGCHHHWFG